VGEWDQFGLSQYTSLTGSLLHSFSTQYTEALATLANNLMSTSGEPTTHDTDDDDQPCDAEEWQPTPEYRWCNIPTQKTLTGTDSGKKALEKATRGHLSTYQDYLEARLDEDDAFKAYTNSTLFIHTSQAVKEGPVSITMRSSCPRLDGDVVGIQPWRSYHTYSPCSIAVTAQFRCLGFDEISPAGAEAEQDPEADQLDRDTIELTKTAGKREAINPLPETYASQGRSHSAIARHRNRVFEFSRRTGSMLKDVGIRDEYCHKDQSEQWSLIE